MLRNILTLVAGLPALLLSIYTFGWIVTGEIELPGLRAKREERAVRFWMGIVVLAMLSLVSLGLAVGIFLGLILPGRL
jgi:hypothetical protein